MKSLDFSIFRTSRSLLSGSAESVLRGNSMEFHSLSEYGSGQSTKHIDWKASARSGKTKIREYAGDHDVRLWIICDTGASMGFGKRGSTKADLAKEIVDLIGRSAQFQGNSFGALVFNEKGSTTFPPTRSPAIFKEVSGVFSSLSAEITSKKRIDSILASLGSLKIGKSPIVIVVDTPFEVSPAFLSLCRRNKVFVLLLQDAMEISGQWIIRDEKGNLVSLKSVSKKQEALKHFIRSISENGAFSEICVTGESPLPSFIRLFHRAHGNIRP